ncbi:MAG: GAF domain-containing protein [Chloroflexi bacterium]|nr:GAF domain-containing protein [Chloroflexota bacterium]
MRVKFVLGSLALTFFVILILGAYLYLRIQDNSQLLISRLEGNIRAQAEEDIVNASREQAALLNNFFESINTNTSIVGASIKNILNNQEALASSGYWDARIDLSQLASGSWDNSNQEPASIFIPAGVSISESLSSKLNLIKHSEFVFPSIMKDNPDIVAIYFGGTSRETIYYPNIDLANIVPSDFDVTGRQWYLAAEPKNNPDNQVVWSAPYEDAALNGLVITASVPVIDENNRFQGVAAMDVQLRRITDQVASIKVGKTGYAFLVDNENRIISLPGAGRNDFGILDENALLSDIIETNALPATTPELSEMLTNIKQSNQGLFTMSLAGAERYITYNIIPQIQYKLVIVVPSAEVLSGVKEIEKEIKTQTRNTINVSLLLIAGVLIIASAIAFAVSNNLTKPLQSLNQTATEIIQGNFRARAKVNSRDELETLAATLNTMTDTVSDLVSSLEQRVFERTAELQMVMQQGQQRAKQYEAITRVSQAISANKNLQELLPQIAEVISEQFGFYHVGIFLNDAANKYAVLVAANSEGGKRMLNRGHQLRVGAQGIVGYVTGNNKPRIASNVGNDAVYFNNPDLPDTQSEMALPLAEGNNVLGALDVQSTEPNAFSEQDLEALTTLAELVTIAIQNAKLYEQMDKSLAESKAISQKFFRENWNRLAEEYRFSGYRYTAGIAAPLINEGHKEETGTEQVDRKQVRVPIQIRGVEIGELSVMVPKNENIKSDQIDVIRAVADRVAVIAENARLFDETSRRAERERLVSEITTKIRGTNDPQEMIQTAIRELREALKVSRIEIIPRTNKSPDR